ncbi:class I SAM-dependent methyltransferase [Tissierella sp. DSM 105185]|uniref:Class I SAM-dependent methyltransferase n=1 Tax=Tissierella pigra TaxID=2607614 RepID=A0A6N7XFN8_9FIRM|nr:class I SAM-dependent methyltransferase [Tissierella pigra]
MEYMGNKEYWDERFKQRNDKPLSPEGVLIDNINCFKKGSVLDIACGDGRNALFFLENGFKITGVDFSLNALERLKRFAEKSNHSIETRQIDLSKPSGLKDIGIFDNIVINHYRLSEENLVDIESHISDDGILFISGFGYKHKVDERIRKQDLIQPMDIEMLKKSFQLIKYIEDDSKRGFLVTYILKKKSSEFKTT